MNIKLKKIIFISIFFSSGLIITNLLSNILIPFEKEDLTLNFYLVKYSLNCLWLLSYFHILSLTILKNDSI